MLAKKSELVSPFYQVHVLHSAESLSFAFSPSSKGIVAAVSPLFDRKAHTAASKREHNSQEASSSQHLKVCSFFVSISLLFFFALRLQSHDGKKRAAEASPTHKSQ